LRLDPDHEKDAAWLPVTLRGTIEAMLRQAHPASMTTREIVSQLVAELCLSFEHPQAKRRWERNTVHRALKRMANKSQIASARATRPNNPNGWRWINDDIPLLSVRRSSSLTANGY
jgi:hypothetical protein